MRDFRTEVLEWLERRGWSQNHLSETAGLSQSLVSKWLAEDEHKRVRPSPDNLEKLARVTGMKYLDLMVMNGYLPVELIELKAGPGGYRQCEHDEEILARYAAVKRILSRGGEAQLSTRFMALLDLLEKQAEFLVADVHMRTPEPGSTRRRGRTPTAALAATA